MSRPVYFTQEDVSDMLNAFSALKVAQFVCQEFEKTVDERFIRDKILSRQNRFRILMPDSLTQREKRSRQTDWLCGVDFCENALLRLMRNGLSYQQALAEIKADFHGKKGISLAYYHQNIECWGEEDVPMKHFRAFLAKDILIQSNLHSSLGIRAYLQKNPVAADELARKIFILTAFSFTEPPELTQRAFDAYHMDFEKQEMLETVREAERIPFIHLVEKTRRFLLDVLIKNHAADIAPTPKEAGEILKKDKDRIFQLAQKYHYINRADKMIAWHHLRDELGHPEQLPHGKSFHQNLPEIIEDFRDVFNTLLGGKNIQIELLHDNQTITDIQREMSEKYQKEFALMQETEADLSPSDVSNLMSAYQLIRSMDALGKITESFPLPHKTNEKPISGAKKWEHLSSLRLIDPQDLPLISEGTKYRNQVAHASATPETYRKINDRQSDMQHFLKKTVERYRLFEQAQNTR